MPSAPSRAPPRAKDLSVFEGSTSFSTFKSLRPVLVFLFLFLVKSFGSIRVMLISAGFVAGYDTRTSYAVFGCKPDRRYNFGGPPMTASSEKRGTRGVSDAHRTRAP